ncbi:MAG: acyl-CoA thioesterase [bacterium]|nr:acyl-CoA thioesterase [bacterium]
MTTPMEHSIEIRVQYNETDGQGRVHHGEYINYFERGRVELLRFQGQNYREFERGGLYLVVSEMNLKYLGAAEFDDLLILTTRVQEVRGVRISHSYELVRPNPVDHREPLTDAPASAQVIVQGYSVVACVDRSGKVRPLPHPIRKLAGQHRRKSV